MHGIQHRKLRLKLLVTDSYYHTSYVSPCKDEENDRPDIMTIYREFREIKRAFTSFNISYVVRNTNNATFYVLNKLVLIE